jgi:AcrR family transcriptional regulator
MTEPRVGLRELKKQRTRLALIDAALDLFLAQGYDRTTIDEIVAAVEVSQRTFFRYFTNKEDVLLGIVADYDTELVRTVKERPETESATEALLAGLRGVLDGLNDSDAADIERWRRTRQLINATPTLTAGQMAYYAHTEQQLTTCITERMGKVSADDLRPTLLAAVFMSSVRVGFEDCAQQDVFEPDAVSARVREAASLTLTVLANAWS